MPEEIIKQSFENYKSFSRCVDDLEQSGWHLLQQPEWIDGPCKDTFFPNDRILTIKGIFDKQILENSHLLREIVVNNQRNVDAARKDLMEFLFRGYMMKIGEILNINNIKLSEDDAVSD